MSNSVLAICIAPGAEEPVQSVESVDLEAGRGIVGDRYFSSTGSFSQKLEVKNNHDWEATLIESEQIDDFNDANNCNFDYGQFRRNIITRGIELNSLVGKRFLIGGVHMEGIRLCEPCAHLARLTDARVLPQLAGRGGLRARVLNSGAICVGDSIVVSPI